MTTYIIILFVAAFIPGFFIIKKPGYNNQSLHYWLVFAGSYIFSITIVHLIPELFRNAANPQILALFILVGFFMQVFIDFLTSGVEHGHAHQHMHMSVLGLMIGMTLHALMDGAILVHSEEHGTENFSAHGMGLLAGIVAHKIPAAIVLVTVLSYNISKKKILFWLLVVFSIASPIGLLIGDMLYNESLIPAETLNYIFAIVSGNFLHISTTIYFESSPQHHFSWRKFIYALLGALLAVTIEMLH